MSGVAAVLLVSMTAPAASAADITAPVTVTLSPPATGVVAVGSALVLDAAAEDATAAPVTAEAWQFATSVSGPFSDLVDGVGSNQLSRSPATLDMQGYYRAAFPDGSGGRVFSAAGFVDVGNAPGALGDPQGPSLVAPGTSFQLSVTPTGDSPLTIVWQSSSTGADPWATVPGATTATASLTAPTDPGVTTYYRARVTNAFGQVTSNAAAVTTDAYVITPVSSVSVSNPAPNKLSVSWTGGSGGGASVTYGVEVLNGSGQVVATRTTTATSTSFTGIAAGAARARVTVQTAYGDSSPVTSSSVTVKALVQTGTVSAAVVRPFRDGYQDSSTFKATSSFAAKGQIKIVTSSGRTVRTYTLATGKAWSVVFNGKTAAGVRLPNATYRVVFVLGGTNVVSRTVTVASSQVSTPSVSWTWTKVYPASDGYRDSTKLTAKTTIPATATLTVTNSNGTRVFSQSLSRRTSMAFTWSGRSSSGSVLPSGRYKAVLAVTGGEGVARSVTTYIEVSGAKLTPVSFSGTISAVNAYDVTILGDYDTGIHPGSLALWSSPNFSTIYGFSATMPSSFGDRYANLKLYSCGYSYSNAGAALLRLDRGYNAHDGWALGNAEGCYGGTVPASLLSGRSMYWAVGNVGENYSFYYVDYFKVTGTKYVLK